MSRDVPPDPDDDADGPGGDGPGPARRLGTTSPGTVTGFALTGLVLGWLFGIVYLRLDRVAPRVGWVPVLALFLAAAVMGGVAWSTHRALRRPAEGRGRPGQRQRLEPHQAVNRLVLGKATALAASLVGGGYAGYALSWTGRAAELASERIRHSLLATLGAALTVVGALLLERACRVRGEDEQR